MEAGASFSVEVERSREPFMEIHPHPSKAVEPPVAVVVRQESGGKVLFSDHILDKASTDVTDGCQQLPSYSDDKVVVLVCTVTKLARIVWISLSARVSKRDTCRRMLSASFNRK